MLKQSLALVAVLGIGCHGFPNRGTECVVTGGCPTPVGAGAAACAAPCPPPTAPPREAAPPKPTAPPEALPPERVERVEQQAQIAQEVMLVPRTVYVPYVAQTPVAPVRLNAVNTIPGRLSNILSQRTTETPAATPPPPSRGEEMAPEERERLQEQIRQLRDKMSRLEEAQRQAPHLIPSRPPAPQCIVPQTTILPECPGPEIICPQDCIVPQVVPTGPQPREQLRSVPEETSRMPRK